MTGENKTALCHSNNTVAEVLPLSSFSFFRCKIFGVLHLRIYQKGWLCPLSHSNHGQGGHEEKKPNSSTLRDDWGASLHSSRVTVTWEMSCFVPVPWQAYVQGYCYRLKSLERLDRPLKMERMEMPAGKN